MNSIDREVLWQYPSLKDVPEKWINSNTTSRVTSNDELASRPIPSSGASQCSPPQSQFNMLIEILWETTLDLSGDPFADLGYAYDVVRFGAGAE